jgi:transcriptional regulator with XRE-family HTH domain
MQQTPNLWKIRETIKSLLKKRGLTYADLAKALHLAEASVKRLMTKGDFSLDRLETIAHWFGLSLFEFLEVVKKSEFQPHRLNAKQEAILEKNPKALRLLLLLGAGFSLAEVGRRTKWPQQQLQKILFVLDKAQLVEIQSGGKVRTNARGPFQMIPEGILRKKYFRAFQKEVLNLMSEEMLESDRLQLTFELYMSDALHERMREELRSVFQKYRGLSRVEHEVVASEKIRPFAGILMSKPHDAWGSVLEKHWL